MKKVFAWICLLAICLLAVCCVCAVILCAELINQSGLLPMFTGVGMASLIVGAVGFGIMRRKDAA